jgi:ankyrin repeat protein
MQNLEHVKWFLDHGADPNLRGRWETTPLRQAALFSSEATIPILQLLLSNGADLDPEALFASMQSREPGGLRVTKFLIEQGISVNVVLPKRPWRGPPYIRSRTPLFHAVHYANTEAVRLLLDLGADKNLTPNGSNLAADFAKTRGYLDIYSLISEH